MDHLALGTFLLIVGGALAVSSLAALTAPGWITIALGCIFIVAHVSVGPTRDV